MAKIILVEDDPMIAEIYQKKFEAAGFEVVSAGSGKEVLKLARESKCDLILLDLIMSEMSGFEVLQEIKSSGKYDPKIKVVIFSNLNDADSQKEAFDKGADGYILKSQFSPTQLVEEIKRMLSESEAQENHQEIKKDSQAEIDSPENKDGKKNILLVEDEDIFCDMFGKKLVDDGFEVEIAKNGAWAMKELMDKKFDLLILDVVMPSMTGLEILQRIKLEDKLKDIPVIVLSASVEDSDLKEMIKMGAKAYFVKTQVVPSELSKKAKEILE